MRQKIKETEKKTFVDRVDNFVEVFSPAAAYRRKAFRFANKIAFSSYKGARKDRLHSYWLPLGNSPDEDLLAELPDLRQRSRDLNRNDGIAAGLTQTMVVNDVGTGIRPQSRLDKEYLGIDDKTADKFQKTVERGWRWWSGYADAAGRMDEYEIQMLVDRQILENGEVILLPQRLKNNNRPYMLAWEVIEADRLTTPSDKISQKNIRSGVELGEKGEPKAYWILKEHPGELKYRTPAASEFIRLDAYNQLGMPNILHLYSILRPGQSRGVPFFAPVLTYFKDLADYLEAEVIAARIAACFALFIKKSDPYSAAAAAPSETNSAGQRLNGIEPGMLEYLNPGEDIVSFNPNRPGNTFDQFVERILRIIGAALGLPYELIIKDFSKTNYSSARAALLQAYKYFRCRQEWLTRRLCQPQWEMLIEEMYLKGELEIDNFYQHKIEWTRARWIAPGWQWVDPLKEVKASIEAMDSGLSCLADELASQGKDYEEILEQLAKENKKRKELGLSKSQKTASQEKDEEEILKETETEGRQ